MTAANPRKKTTVKTTESPVLTRRGQQRQEVLLAVAAEHFLSHGYQGSSLDAIIAQAGGSKGAIYRHFNGKEGLFSAVVEQLCYEFLTDLRAIDVRECALPDGLRMVLLELVHVLAQPRHAAFYRLIVAGSAQFPDAGKTWYEHGPARWFDVLMQLFNHQREQGIVTSDIPIEHIARILFDAVLSNLTTQFVILGKPIEVEETTPLIEELISMTQARFAVRSANAGLAPP
ncbi:TetR/AcrR family transcriptional regulator [Lampropedia puyangensis]|uniref:TetR/AcrR family transcriptional regulator n=1 Tax=Lampropedia puyangensis TaxID=1330072 RepID=A0A4V4GRJ7_9BURK|nr:TetR/AcrR family transcriptional regulator [Lampropedia puyangensis]THU02526.1 TetR/AcrR family transcriptional regulator [Lampropedia puyangensis]